MVRRLKDKNILFLHVPRTGGTFFENSVKAFGIRTSRWVRNKCPTNVPKKHALLGHFHRHAVADIEYCIAFVRDIPAFYQSTWMWLAQAGRGGRGRMNRWQWHPFKTAAKLFRPNFSQWCYALTSAEPAWATRLFEQYVGPEGGEFCRFIGHTETIELDFCSIAGSLGYDTTGWINRMGDIQSNSSKGKLIEQACFSPGALARVETSELAGIRRWDTDQRWYGNVGFDSTEIVVEEQTT